MPETYSAKQFENLPACSSSDTKQLDSTKEALRTSQNDDVPSDVSSHRTGSPFSLDALSKTLLQDRLTDLKDLIQGEDGQAVSQDIQNLVARVLGEIESWLNQGEEAMEFAAQITLSNMAYNGPTKNNIRNQFSCKNEKHLLASYLSLLRSATSNDALSNEKQRILSKLLNESEEFVKDSENAMTDKVHQDELNLLHEICDGDIALHSVELAIQIVVDKSQQQALLPSELHNKGIELQERFENLGHISDLENAIAMKRKAIISTSLKSAYRPLMLSSLGTSYQSRYERFGDVKDIDAAIRQQSKAVASIPRDSTHRPAILLNLGNAYGCRFERFGERNDIDFAINQMIEAFTTSPLESTYGTERLINIGNLYLRRFEWFGDIEDLNSAIERQLEAVASIPLNTADPVVHTNLGNSYRLRFERFGAMKDIDSAIEQQLKGAASTPLNSVDRPGIFHNLGNSYQRRFESFGNIQDLESAIKHQHEAVASIPLSHPKRPGLLSNLGSSYSLRFERYGEKKDIDFAIEQHLEAVASAPPDSPERAGYLNNLGLSYRNRFTRFGEVNDIDSAIDQHLEALLSTPANSPKRDTFLNNSGISYQIRFEHSGQLKDIDSAIERHLEAVASIPLDSPKRPGYIGSLGNSYCSRFLRFREMTDIDLAIKQQLEAVTSTPLESAIRTGLLNNLGLSYQHRFHRLGEMKDIESSIKLLLEAVSSTPFNSPDRPISANNLGKSYADLFTHSGDMKDIDLAIEKHIEAIAAVPIDSPHRPGFLDHLGRSYCERFNHSGNVKDIDLAIKHSLEAVKVASISPSNRPVLFNSLGTLYLFRFKQFREVKDIDHAIEKLVEAVQVATTPLDSADRPLILNNLGESYLYRFRSNQEPADLEESISSFRLSSLSLKGLPSERIQGSLQWAHLAHEVGNLGSASEAYDQAIRLLPQVAWIGLNALAQLNELNSDIQSLGCNAAACMIDLAQAEDHNRQRHLGRAIELLDQGRSILWSQTSNFKQDLEDLRRVDSELASDLDSAGKFLAQGCFRDPKDPLSETDAQLYRRNAEKWEELVHRIRGLPRFHHFLLPLPISTLQTAAADGPVVIINSSDFRCDAVIVLSQGDLVLVPLPHITAAELGSLATQLASRKSNQVWIPSNSNSMPSETLEQVLNRTWSLVGEPIAQKFEELGLVRRSEVSSKSRVWWCLTGSFSSLPIHASFPPTKPDSGMMDIVVSSYTPTISTLLRAQQRNKLKRPTFRMLAVGQSSIVGMTPLPGVTKEIAFIQKKIGVEALTLEECKATVDGVAASLPTCSWAHFACHGVQDPDKPMDSGLVMWDRHRLTLSRLAQSSLAFAEFAFLSCCESAKGSKQFPNEAMHLAAGLQYIGYRGVIGTMWSVGDKDALSVAIQIYEELFKDGTDHACASKAALALHQAVLLLRANNVPLARWVPFVHFGL